jgi:hypothetical protein
VEYGTKRASRRIWHNLLFRKMTAKGKVSVVPLQDRLHVLSECRAKIDVRVFRFAEGEFYQVSGNFTRAHNVFADGNVSIDYFRFPA